MQRLEKEYNIIKKVRPLLAKPNTRTVKYRIEDNFLNFWFRFIYKYRSAVEAGNMKYIKEIILRDCKIYSGRILEKYFIRKLKTLKKYNNIGTYWEKGNKNEIDIVAINEVEKRVLFAEVKRNKNKINLDILKEKSKKLLPKFKNFNISYRGFSLEDM